MSYLNHKGVQFFDRLMAYAFYALIFFLPISTALVEIFTVLALISYIIKRSIIFTLRLKNVDERKKKISFLFCDSFKPPATPLNQPVMIFLCVCLFSVFISQRPSLSFHGFLGKVLQNAFLFFNFVEAISTKKRLKIFLGVFISSCCLICLSGLNQYYLGMDFVRFNIKEHARINSSFRAPNDFAAYLVIVIPILLSLVLTVHKKKFFASKKLVTLVDFTTLISLASLGLTYSRGGWLAFGISLAVFSLSSFKLFLKMAIPAAAFVGFFTFRLVKERMYINFTNLFGGFGRSIYWKEAFSMIKDYPLFGSGINTYSIIARNYKVGWGGYPHNCYLQLTAELGLVGLASFLWMLFSLYKTIFKTLKNKTSSLRTLLVGTTAGFTGFLFHSAFDTFFYSVQLGSLMWVIMGLLIVLTKLENTSKA